VARYKVLKSVAHSMGQSFTSTLTWWDGDYVMGHLLRRAREVHQGTLVIDLLSGTAQPTALCIPPVTAAVTRCPEGFRGLVHSHRSNMQFVRAATMTVAYDLGVQRPSGYSSTGLESPYVCRVEITDDRGKVWASELKGWWVPQPLRPRPDPRRRRHWWEFWKPAA